MERWRARLLRLMAGLLHALADKVEQADPDVLLVGIFSVVVVLVWLAS